VEGVTLFVGSETVDAQPQTSIGLKPGRQVLSFIIDRGKRSEALRVEVDDVPGSSARFMIVGGK
jgi:hypothetical protein